jgi:hypothetical protein
MITIITTSDKKKLTKQYSLKEGKISCKDYDGIYEIDWRQEKCDSISDLHTILNSLLPQDKSCIIRGTPKAGLSPRKVLRRKINFEDIPINWMCLDFDSVVAPDWLEKDFLHYSEYLISLLPEYFDNVSYVCQWSNSAFLNPALIKAHIWFWLGEARTSDELRKWVMETFKVVEGDVEHYTIDYRTMVSVQPHYTGKPDFTDGIVDPVQGNRVQFVQKIENSVIVPIIPLIVPVKKVRGIKGVVSKTQTSGSVGNYLYEIGRKGNYTMEIWKACLSEASTPNFHARTEAFKKQLRTAIDNGPRASERKERYKTDKFLDEDIEKARIYVEEHQFSDDISKADTRKRATVLATKTNQEVAEKIKKLKESPLWKRLKL